MHNKKSSTDHYQNSRDLLDIELWISWIMSWLYCMRDCGLSPFRLHYMYTNINQLYYRWLHPSTGLSYQSIDTNDCLHNEHVFFFMKNHKLYKEHIEMLEILQICLLFTCNAFRIYSIDRLPLRDKIIDGVVYNFL